MKSSILILCVFFFQSLFSGDVLVFYHVPKCAGTSVASLLGQKFHTSEIYHKKAKNINDQIYLVEMDLNAVDLESVRYIHGHIPYRLTSLVPEGKNITFIRDPVERIYSHFRYASENSKDPIDFYTFYPEISNMQVRYFSTLPSDDPTFSLAEHLESAKQNLSDAFFFVGICEQMTKSLTAFYKLMGWEPLTITPIFNTTSGKNGDDTELYSFVYESEWADRELYKHAKKLFREHFKKAKEVVVEQEPIDYVDSIHFTVDQPLDGEGWGYRELDLQENRHLRQSYLKEAYIRFPLEKHHYVFEFLACSPPNNNLNRLDVIVNGKKVNIKRCSNSHWSKFRGIIPQSLISEGKTKITFKVPKLYVPSEHEDVPDHRKLGVGISEITLKRFNR